MLHVLLIFLSIFDAGPLESGQKDVRFSRTHASKIFSLCGARVEKPTSSFAIWFFCELVIPTYYLSCCSCYALFYFITKYEAINSTSAPEFVYFAPRINGFSSIFKITVEKFFVTIKSVHRIPVKRGDKFDIENTSIIEFQSIH